MKPTHTQKVKIDDFELRLDLYADDRKFRRDDPKYSDVLHIVQENREGYPDMIISSIDLAKV